MDSHWDPLREELSRLAVAVADTRDQLRDLLQRVTHLEDRLQALRERRDKH